MSIVTEREKDMDLSGLLNTEHSISHLVDTLDTAVAFGSGGVEVLATPALVALAETAARDAVQKLLPPGYTTVGSVINLRHLAPTPAGREVRVTSRVIAVAGRRITFEVSARDDAGTVGEGAHERIIVDLARFTDKAAARFRGMQS
ncbi:MAG: thioesterase family protein [Candidatus Eisenbacteria bacterium]|jgi:predicted thioesterase|nr:thioesterase family protein [Candidatus Eisenbacteria bacterium]